jgi:hypothetical protein
MILYFSSCEPRAGPTWFNGRIEDVLQGHPLKSGEDLKQTLARYLWLYNQQLPQPVLGGKTPLLAVKD